MPDNAGNRATKTNYLNGITEGYTYDLIYQLTQVTQGASTTESYTYDAVGNRLSSLSVPSYSYNASNELTSSSNGSYTYDNNGNTLTDAQGRSYAWDFENHLTQVVNPGVGTTTFKYDPFGRRVQKSGPLGTTNYLFDVDDIEVELDQSGNVLAHYSHGSKIDQVLAAQRSGSTRFYLQDALGSTTSLTGQAGITDSYTYESFGKMATSNGNFQNPFRYTGREFEQESGIYYYRARYYDQSIGRFLSEDPAAFQSDMSFYRYVRNMPLALADPTGLFPTSVHWQWTYDLALAVFGPRCADKARAVADANAATDALPSFRSKVQFLLFMGDGWRDGGPHFPDLNKDDSLSNAYRSCNLNQLGRALHSRQDWFAHRGATPLLHYLTGTIIDNLAATDISTVNETLQDTSMILMEFKRECLKCCQ